MNLLAILIGVLYAGISFAASASPFAGCPAHGDSAIPRIRQLDLLKNRSNAPTNIDPSVTLQALLRPGDDSDRWEDDVGATVTGWVIEVQPGGYESVNCHATAIARRDVHIELAPSLDSPDRQAVVVEVTPYWKRKLGWTERGLRRRLLGHQVTVTGWMFYDSEHWQNAVNSNPDGTLLWRATAWELHPVTAIKVP